MLSKKTKYGIKALTYLARQEQNVPVSIATISEMEKYRLHNDNGILEIGKYQLYDDNGILEIGK